MNFKNKLSISIKVGILLFVGVIIILVGGFFSYKSLSSVVKLMHQENAPQNGFFTIRNITTSIDQVESNIRLYGLTKQRVYLKKYQTNIHDIDSNFQTLKVQYPDDKWFSSKIDTINQLLNSRLKLWDEMINLWQSDSTDQVFLNLAEELKTTKDTSQRNFFKRIFSSKKDESNIDNEKILERLHKIEYYEQIIENKLLEKESELTASSNLINDAFISLMEQLENYEKNKELEHYNNAEELAQIAYNRLTFFSILGVFLSLVVLIVIVKYIRKNRQYNDILISSRLEAESLAKSKELFMAKVSHEIRTPLSAISGFIKQIRKEPLEPELKSQIKIIDLASDQLIRLINDVLDFTKLQSDKLFLHKTHFDPVVVIDNVCNLFYELAKSKGNHINHNINNKDSLILFGDINRFQQILYNLLSNAVKFTENGIIEVEANINQEDADSVLLELIVKDNGLGIDQSKLDFVFQEYTQEDQNIATRYGGTGLGLTIVKKIAELFKGDIQLESTKGKGTKAICTLRFEPGKREEIEDQNKEQIVHQFPENLSILLADDEDYNRLLISSILKKWNLKFDIAKNGLEAIEYLKQKSYDYVLMDIRMPVINGVMATKFIRETYKLSSDKTKVIGITADTPDSIQNDVKELFNEILAKPFSEDELYQVLQNNPEKRHQIINEKEAENSKTEEIETDLSNLIRAAGDDLNFVEEMIQKFKESTEKGLKEMKVAIENNQYNLVADLAHKLIPASRHLGIKKLVVELKQIEENALNENKIVILSLLHEAVETTAMALKSLQMQFQKIKK